MGRRFFPRRICRAASMEALRLSLPRKPESMGRRAFALEPWINGMNRHCEERSDKAIHRRAIVGCLDPSAGPLA
jgi:hypothetical protein